jgi:ribosome-associated toxin RatA of RatAB toxin-antitoxin module
MFNGLTKLQDNPNDSYLGIFAYQQPVDTHLKDIFPSTTAYSISFAISDQEKFESYLGDWQSKNDSKNERSSLFSKIKKETGIGLKKEFTKLLGTEFAEVTTRFHEKIAIIEVKDGSRMRTLLTNISQMNDDNIGLLSYEKLPQLLLGDAFTILKKPYFKIFDNYLVLTNSILEMKSYDDTYNNRKFLNKTEGYNKFDALLAERSNVSFFIQFKNAQQLFKQDMKPEFYDAFENMVPGWKNFYAAAWQFTSSDKNYYTNFCMRLSNDTTVVQ